MKKRFLKENDWDLEGGDLLLDDLHDLHDLDEFDEDPDYEYEEEFDYHYDDDYGNYEDEEILDYPRDDYHEFYETNLSESFEDDDLDDWDDVPSEEYRQRQRLGAEARRAERLRNDREIKNISNRELELERRSALDPYEERFPRRDDIDLERMEKLRSQEDYLDDDFDDLDEMLWDEEMEARGTFESRTYPNKRDHIRKEYDSFLDDELSDIRDEDRMYQQDLELLGPEVEYFDRDFDKFDDYDYYDSEEAELDLWDDSEYLDSLENDYLE